MTDSSPPLYVSRPSFKSMGQEYRIYADRLEVAFFRFFPPKLVPMGDILSCEVRPPLVIGDLFRGKGPGFSLALKLDFADLYEHVAIHKTTGFKRWRITPDDPEAFCRALESAMGMNGAP